jgi:type II secretory pathway component PulF
MPQFTYQALAPDGQTVQGGLEATTRREAYRELQARRLSPLEVREATAGAAAVEAAAAASRPARLSRAKLIFFTSELADLLEAGLPVQQALTVMAEKQQDPAIRLASARTRLHLQDGETLSASFRQASPSFDDLYTSLVAAGEASGSLAGVLQRMAVSMAQLHELQKKFTQAMVYPAFMIGACALLMAVFALVLVPQLTGLLAKTGQSLPAVARGLLSVSHFATTHFWTILITGAAAAALFRALLATTAGRLWWDRFKLRLPLVGPIVDTRFHATFTQALGNLVTNGVPLLSALRLLVRGTANRFFQARLGQVIESVGSGETLSQSLRRAGGFQPLLSDIVAVGEQTGQLSRSLQKASSRYDRELDNRIRRLTSLVSPVIIVFLAIVVTIVAYCIVASIFSAISGIRAKSG